MTAFADSFWEVRAALYATTLLFQIAPAALGILAVEAGRRRSGAWAVALYVSGLLLLLATLTALLGYPVGGMEQPPERLR